MNFKKGDFRGDPAIFREGAGANGSDGLVAVFEGHVQRDGFVEAVEALEEIVNDKFSDQSQRITQKALQKLDVEADYID
jgi:hypothetical protein